MQKTTYAQYTAIFFSLFSTIFFSSYQVASATTSADRTALVQQIHTDLITQAIIDTTGGNSTFKTTTKTSDTTIVENTNNAAITQEANISANTGGNYTGRNISFGGDAGVIYTGNAQANVTASIIANQNETVINENGDGIATENIFYNTGDDTTSSQTATATKTTLVNNTNQTVINQVTTASADTGNNITERNISFGGSAGSIVTGAAGTSVNYLVTTNDNKTVALVGGESEGNGPGSGASIVVNSTGDTTTFSLYDQLQDLRTVNNTNTAQITQSCGTHQSTQQTCSAVTGGNTTVGSIAYNGDSGIIKTGNAYVVVDLLAAFNSSKTNINTNPIPAASQTDITNTGDTAAVETDASITTHTTATNTNTAQITQTVNAVADTGHNRTERNISFGGDAGVIYTGNALVDVFMGVLANSSPTSLH